MPGITPDYLTTPDTIVGNAYYGGASPNWRYLANGVAFMLTMSVVTGISLLFAVSGVADAAITWIDTADFDTGGAVFFHGTTRVDAASDGNVLILASPGGNLEISTVDAIADGVVSFLSTGNNIRIGISADFGVGVAGTKFTGNVGINVNPSAYALDAVGDIRTDGTITVTGVTGSLPARIDSSHRLQSGKIDLAASSNVIGTGLGSGDWLKWSGSALSSVGVGISAVIATINSFSTNTKTFVTGLSGTIPAGLTVTTDSISYVSGLSQDTHTVTDGQITS